MITNAEFRVQIEADRLPPVDYSTGLILIEFTFIIDLTHSHCQPNEQQDGQTYDGYLLL